MKYFEVKYRHHGKFYHKTFQSKDQDALKAHLEAKNYLVIEVMPKAQSRRLEAFLPEPKTKELISAFYEFKLGMRANFALLELLAGIKSHCKNKLLARRFDRAKKYIQGGNNIAESFELAGFSEFICAMLKVGQKTGYMLASIDLIITRLRAADHARKAITKVLLYPAVIIILMVAVFLGITIFVLPQFQALFSGFSGELPPISRSLLSARALVLEYGQIALAALGMLAILLTLAYKKRPAFRARADWLFLRIPVFGGVLWRFDVVQFLQSFLWLYRANLDIKDTLTISARAMRNTHLRALSARIYHILERGTPLQISMSRCGLFNDISAQMLSTSRGDEGFLEALEAIKQLYSEELEERTSRLLAAIEPVMIICLGGLVLWLALGIFMPLWELPLQAQQGG